MTWPLVIVLSGAPRGKARPRAAVGKDGHAHVYPEGKTVKYEAQLRFAAQQMMAGAAPTMQPVRVAIEARLPIAASWSKGKQAAAEIGHLRPATKPDAVNIGACLDALNAVVFGDDRQIVDLTIAKVYSRTPGLTVVVCPVEPPALPDAPRPRQPQPSDLFAEAVA